MTWSLKNTAQYTSEGLKGVEGSKGVDTVLCFEQKYFGCVIDS